MADANANAPEPAPPQGTGGIVGVVVNGADRLSKYSPQQVVHLVLIVSIVALGWLSHSTMSLQMDMQAAQMRHAAEREELMRQHCANECDKSRVFHAAQADLQRKHDSERDDKTRALILAHLRGKGGDE